MCPSAWQSAEDVDAHFEAGDRLLQMLSKLVTTYVDTLVAKGDAQARLVFASGEYCAKESSTTSKGQLGSLRRFLYKGDQVAMERHLKIGVANNRTTTLRVYFLWDAEAQKVVIGWCGEHLPTSTVQH